MKSALTNISQHKPLRSLEEVTRDILALEAETEGLLKKLVNLAETSVSKPNMEAAE